MLTQSDGGAISRPITSDKVRSAALCMRSVREPWHSPAAQPQPHASADPRARTHARVATTPGPRRAGRYLHRARRTTSGRRPRLPTSDDLSFFVGHRPLKAAIKAAICVVRSKSVWVMAEQRASAHKRHGGGARMQVRAQHSACALPALSAAARRSW